MPSKKTKPMSRVTAEELLTDLAANARETWELLEPLEYESNGISVRHQYQIGGVVRLAKLLEASIEQFGQNLLPTLPDRKKKGGEA